MRGDHDALISLATQQLQRAAVALGRGLVDGQQLAGEQGVEAQAGGAAEVELEAEGAVGVDQDVEVPPPDDLLSPSLLLRGRKRGAQLLDRRGDVGPGWLAVPRSYAGVLCARVGCEGGLDLFGRGGELCVQGCPVGGVDVLGALAAGEAGGVVVEVSLAPGEGELGAGFLWKGGGQGGGYGAVPV